jgi:hypothetical protein
LIIKGLSIAIAIWHYLSGKNGEGSFVSIKKKERDLLMSAIYQRESSTVWTIAGVIAAVLVLSWVILYWQGSSGLEMNKSPWRGSVGLPAPDPLPPLPKMDSPVKR